MFDVQEFPKGIPNLLKTRFSPNRRFLYGDDNIKTANPAGWQYTVWSKSVQIFFLFRHSQICIQSPVNHTWATFDSFVSRLADTQRKYHLYVSECIVIFFLQIDVDLG